MIVSPYYPLRPLDRRDMPTRSGFTLVELLVSIMILGLLATIILLGIAGATEKAREERTRSQITKINALIHEKWDSLLTRRIKTPPGLPPANDFSLPHKPPRQMAWFRLQTMRQLMRMELPDNRADVIADPGPFYGIRPQSVPACWRAYRQKLQSLVKDTNNDGTRDWRDEDDWTTNRQSSECLYLILSQLEDGGRNALEFFNDREIQDGDGDGIPEILDAWGTPIEFLRWAPGFAEQFGNDATFKTADDIPSPSVLQTRDTSAAPDPLDPMRVDPRWRIINPKLPVGPYALFPLVVSAGPDKEFGIIIVPPQNLFQYESTVPVRNDPYWVSNDGQQLGDRVNDTADDNIHNHL